MSEPRHELVFGHQSEPAGLLVARDVGRRPRMTRIVGFLEAFRPTEARPDEDAGHLVALRVARPAERDRLDEIVSRLHRRAAGRDGRRR